MTRKICIIGAGSAVFSLSIIRDLCLTPTLGDSVVSFMDRDQQRLDAAHSLCTRYAKEVGATLRLEKTLERREALDGAEFVVNAALAGSHTWLREGWAIAQRHGYRFGGSLHVMHDEAFWVNFYQLQLFDSLIQDILTLCPHAWYIQSANPVMGGITYLARTYPQANIVGLCHGYAEIYEIARMLGLDREHLTFEMPGVNHFIWLTRAYYKGQDVFPLLDQWIANEAEQKWHEGSGGSLRPKQVDLYQRFGALPIGDTGSEGGGSWGWWYHTDEETERRWQEDPQRWWSSYFASMEERVAAIKRASEDQEISVTKAFPPQPSGESIVPLIESIACDIPRVMIVNVQNRGGYVPGIPHDFAAEIPALVSKRGIESIQTQGLPPAVLAYALRDCVAPWNLELDAYTHRSKQYLLDLLMMDHWTRSEQQTRELLEDILALPYHKPMRTHYR